MNPDDLLKQLERQYQDLTVRMQVLEQRERKLQYLLDRAEILDCVARHARGCDRFDSELLASAYHEDGVDEHGFAINPGPEYPEWANAQHSRGSLQNMHNITTHSCEIDGDVAHAESYVIGLFLNTDGKTARLLAGRYADRLERRNGAWRILLRRSTVDVALAGDASFLTLPYFVDMGFVKGMRDKRDVSYQRPLTLDETPADRW
jgi:SnoaL-like domain